MRPTNDPDAPSSAQEDLALTRVSVLNVLVGVGLMIAASGWLIRRRADDPAFRPVPGLHDALLLALLASAVGSYLIRRRWLRRETLAPDDQTPPDFHRSHVAAAVVAALGVPIGLAYGWFVDPRFEGVAPFWIIPMAMGWLAIPRRSEPDRPIRGQSSDTR